MIITVKGLVTAEVPIGDYDKLLTVFTKEYGKITVMGKGIRSIKSRYMTATQLFCYSEFVLSYKEDRYWLREAVNLEIFFNIRNYIERVALAEYLLDLLNAYCVEGEEDPELLRLVLNSLYAIDKNIKPREQIKAVFELKIGCISGFMPDLVACHNCGKYIDDNMYLDIIDPRLVCSECISQIKHDKSLNSEPMYTVRITGAVLTAMRFVAFSPIEKCLSFVIGDSDMKIFSNICERYAAERVEKKLDTLKFYKEVSLNEFSKSTNNS